MPSPYGAKIIPQIRSGELQQYAKGIEKDEPAIRYMIGKIAADVKASAAFTPASSAIADLYACAYLPFISLDRGNQKTRGSQFFNYCMFLEDTINNKAFVKVREFTIADRKKSERFVTAYMTNIIKMFEGAANNSNSAQERDISNKILSVLCTDKKQYVHRGNNYNAQASGIYSASAIYSIMRAFSKRIVISSLEAALAELKRNDYSLLSGAMRDRPQMG
jgi:hypothetical protein